MAAKKRPNRKQAESKRGRVVDTQPRYTKRSKAAVAQHIKKIQREGINPRRRPSRKHD